MKFSLNQLIVIVFLFIYSQSFSANRYWVGSGSGLWNSTTNWSDVSGGSAGFSVPGSSDVANFDGGNSSNCVINANVNVAGFIITGLYSGTINVNTGITSIIGTSGFSQAAGIFNANSGNISMSGSFLLSGGTFNATSGVLQLSGGYTYSGGTFNHNNGMVSFSLTQTISGNSTFNNISFIANGGVYTISSGTTITSLNNVTISGSGYYVINTGVVEIKGDLTLSAIQNNSANGGTATFLFDGSGIQNITSAISTINAGTNEKSSTLPNVEINKTSGSLNLIGLISLSGTSWKTTAGASLVNPGTSTLNINSGVTFSGQNLSLYDIHIFANGQIMTLSPASYTLTSTHNVTINGSGYYQFNTGVLEILGDLTLINTSTSAVNGGTGTFLFDGTGVQNINSSVSSLNNVCSLPNVIINKSVGALNLSGVINFSGSTWNTISGASLVNAGTSVVNIMKTTVLSGQNLSLYDITVTGNFSTITISTGLTWTSSHLITLAGGSSWYQINTGTLNAKGDVIVTNTNNSNNVGGNAILLFDGNANQTLTGSGVSNSGRLPQVHINKTGGVLTLSNSIISMDNNWNYIAGNVDASTNSSTVDFYKTAIIDGQGTSNTMAFHHVIISGTMTLAGKLDVNGDFTIRTGTSNRLDVTAANNYQFNLAGNWVNNNSITPTSFNQQSGSVIFDGAGAQLIGTALSSDIETFYNLEINKSGGVLTLNAPVTISNNINLVLGKVISSATYLLLIDNAATATSTSNNSFVSGPVRKTGNQVFTFPVGKNAVYAPIAISSPSVNTDQFTAEYFEVDPDPSYNVLSKDASLEYLSRCEYWILDRTTGSSNVTVRLSWDTRSCPITSAADLKVARWDGAQWRDHGNGGTTVAGLSGTVVSSGVVSSFSPFTLASVIVPLAVEMTDISSECEGTNTVIRWSTESEKNNDYFIVERSIDGIEWENIGEVVGAGNSSSTLNYIFTDVQRGVGISYYRVKQIDFDGKFEYSHNIVFTECTSETLDLVAYPNPSNGIFHFMYNGEKNDVSSIEVFNVMGEKVFTSSTYQPIIDLSGNPNGLYLVRLYLNTKVLTVNLLLNN